MARQLVTLVAILAACAACTSGLPCELRATLERGDAGSTLRFYDKGDTLLASCRVPPTALGACDSSSASCADPAGNAVSLCAFDGCFTAPAPRRGPAVLRPPSAPPARASDAAGPGRRTRA